MSARDHLSPQEFGDELSVSLEERSLRADVQGKPVGWMEFAWPDQHGVHTIERVEVEPDHRRQGIATAMWRQAESAGLNPRHSTSRSAAGDEWANSVGGDLPPNLYPWDPGDDDDDLEAFFDQFS